MREIDLDAAAGAWRRYEHDRTDAARDEIVAYYKPLLRFVVRRIGLGLPAMASKSQLWDDGNLGLSAAVEAFDRESGHTFETVALTLVRSSITDALRARGGIPVSWRWRRYKLEKALTARFGRELTWEELEPEIDAAHSAYLGAVEMVPLSDVTIGRLDALWDLSDADADRVSALGWYPEGAASALQRDMRYDEVWPWLIRLLSENGPVAHPDQSRRWMAEAMSQLHDPDRLILWLYYHENMRVLDIGGLIYLASGRVPMTTGRAILRMRRELTARPASLWTFADDPDEEERPRYWVQML